jgi:uncharacterized membrane protein YpjA
MKIRVWTARMSFNMAALTEQGHLPDQKLAVVASMGVMANKAVLFHRWVFP